MRGATEPAPENAAVVPRGGICHKSLLWQAWQLEEVYENVSGPGNDVRAFFCVPCGMPSIRLVFLLS